MFRFVCIAAALCLLPAAALADPCELCDDLDEAEEMCEAEFGDGHVVCEAIGALEEACPQDDDAEAGEAPDGPDESAEAGPDAACPDLCGDVPALVERCAAELGADHPVCAELTEDHADECLGLGDDDDDDEADDDDDADDDDEDEPAAGGPDGGVGGGAAGRGGEDDDDDAWYDIDACSTSPGRPSAPSMPLALLIVMGGFALRRRTRR